MAHTLNNRRRVSCLQVLAVSTLGWLAIAVIWVALAFWPARGASRKGHSFVGYFILSFAFPLALILAYAVGDRAHPHARGQPRING